MDNFELACLAVAFILVLPELVSVVKNLSQNAEGGQ